MANKVLVTTSLKPTSDSRRLQKILSHILVRSERVSRGRLNFEEIHNRALQIQANYVFIISHDRAEHLLRVHIFSVSAKRMQKEPIYLEISEVIDHLIYGWEQLPGRPPLSTGGDFEAEYPDLTKILVKYFEMKLYEKTELWVAGNSTEHGTYLQCIDQLTLQPVFSLKIVIR